MIMTFYYVVPESMLATFKVAVSRTPSVMMPGVQEVENVNGKDFEPMVRCYLHFFDPKDLIDLGAMYQAGCQAASCTDEVNEVVSNISLFATAD